MEIKQHTSEQSVDQRRKHGKLENIMGLGKQK